MDSWEQRLSNVQPVQPEISAHRDRLRQHLRDGLKHPHQRHGRPLLTAAIVVVGLLACITVIRPSWASELIRIVFVGEHKITAADGTKYTARTYRAESSESTPPGTAVHVDVTDDGHNANTQARIGTDPELEQMQREAAQIVQNGRAEVVQRDGGTVHYKVTLQSGHKIIYTVGPGDSWSITKLD